MITRFNQINLLLIASVLFLIPDAKAQVVGGNALGLIVPSSDFANTYVVGGNFNGNLEIPVIQNLNANIEVGVQSWFAEDLPDGTSPDEANTYSVGAGGKYFLTSRFFAGFDGVYYFGDFKEFSIVPNAGLRLGKFNLELSAGITDPITYIGFELGYFWATN